jgi:hypothetical protein
MVGSRAQRERVLDDLRGQLAPGETILQTALVQVWPGWYCIYVIGTVVSRLLLVLTDRRLLAIDPRADYSPTVVRSQIATVRPVAPITLLIDADRKDVVVPRRYKGLLFNKADIVTPAYRRSVTRQPAVHVRAIWGRRSDLTGLIDQLPKHR